MANSGGGGGTSGSERAVSALELELHNVKDQLTSATAEAEAARLQTASALREQTSLRAHVATLTDRLAMADAERDATDAADARVRKLFAEAQADAEGIGRETASSSFIQQLLRSRQAPC